VAYQKEGYPTELANKIGHVKLIQDPMIQRLIEAFEDHRPPSDETLPNNINHIDLEDNGPIEQVVTVDGGHQVVPNVALPERQVGFIQVASQLIRIETLDHIRNNPMADPREIRRTLSNLTHHTLAALPVAGVHIPGLSVRQSVRDSIHRFLLHYQLYEALSYLVYRSWEANPSEKPSMHCLKCGELIQLERDALRFSCRHCGEDHNLSDYLGLCEQDSDDLSSAEVVSNFRSVLEVLVLFSLIIRFRDRNTIMGHTLFLLDGPLILRAQLSRLIEPIRALIAHQRQTGNVLYLLGIEKSGGFRAFADIMARRLTDPGDYYIPSTQYLLEQVYGRAFEPETYRNRVNYGAKVVFRAGPDHVLALNIPTGEYVFAPSEEDLIGFPSIAKCLSKLICYRHENAIIPVILANAEASISNQPSGGLLAQFVDRILSHE
jgi:hypothetical protein